MLCRLLELIQAPPGVHIPQFNSHWVKLTEFASWHGKISPLNSLTNCIPVFVRRWYVEKGRFSDITRENTQPPARWGLHEVQDHRVSLWLGESGLWLLLGRFMQAEMAEALLWGTVCPCRTIDGPVDNMLFANRSSYCLPNYIIGIHCKGLLLIILIMYQYFILI